MIDSLRLRLAVGALVAIVVVLAGTGYFLSAVFTDYVVERYRNEMGGIIDQLAVRLDLRDGRLVLTGKPTDPRYALPASGRYWQVAPDGGEIIRSESLWDTELEPAGGGTRHGFLRAEGPDGASVLVMARQLTLKVKKEQKPFRIFAAIPEAEFDAGLADYHSAMERMLLVTAAVLMAAAYLQGRVGLNPLNRLKSGVAKVRQGQSNRLDDTGPREVRPLVTELNLLLNERETAIERARARASDLAHGLKTPLTVLMHLSEHLPEADRALARQQVELVRQRADRQLQAARLGVEQMVSTNLGSLAGKLVMVLGPVTKGRGIAWHMDIPPLLSIQADAADIAECLGNVLDNASKWARSAISIHAREAGGWVDVTVEDDGPGADPALHATILQRGGQGEDRDDGLAGGSADAGNGLGLAISADIVRAYGGAIQLGKASLGGLQVRLRLPGKRLDGAQAQAAEET